VWGNFSKVLQGPGHWFFILRHNLLIEQPGEKNVKELSWLVWLKSACHLDPINKVSKTKVFDPKVEQILLNT